METPTTDTTTKETLVMRDASPTLEKGKTYIFHPYQGVKIVQIWEDMKDGSWIGINQTTNRTIRVWKKDLVREKE